MAPAETPEHLDLPVDDFHMVPIVAQPQLIPNRNLELDVYFDGSSSSHRSVCM